jgi:hypothetical protein
VKVGSYVKRSSLSHRPVEDCWQKKVYWRGELAPCWHRIVAVWHYPVRFRIKWPLLKWLLARYLAALWRAR